MHGEKYGRVRGIEGEEEGRHREGGKQRETRVWKWKGTERKKRNKN